MKKFYRNTGEKRKVGSIAGIATNSGEHPTTRNGLRCDIYLRWKAMINRVYNSKTHENKGNGYVDVSVCDEWLEFSNFRRWFVSQEGFDKGYDLDKDLKVKGSRVYSPDTCLLLPKEINSFLTGCFGKYGKDKTGLPLGVYFNKASRKYKAQINIDGCRVGLGSYNTPEGAFAAFKEAKEDRARSLIKKYEGLISTEASNALRAFTVNIDD